METENTKGLSIWQCMVYYINSHQNQSIYRSQLIAFLKRANKQFSERTIDKWRRMLTVLEYLEYESTGKYKVIKQIEYSLSSTKLEIDYNNQIHK